MVIEWIKFFKNPFKIFYLTISPSFVKIITLKGSSSQIICGTNRQYIPLDGIGCILKNKTFIVGYPYGILQ